MRETFVYTCIVYTRQWDTFLLLLLLLRAILDDLLFPGARLGCWLDANRPRTRENIRWQRGKLRLGCGDYDRIEKCRPRKRYLVAEGSPRNSRSTDARSVPDRI